MARSDDYSNVGRKRVKTADQRKNNTLVALLPRHFKMLDLFLEGLSVGQVAERVGVSARMVGFVRKSPLFQGEFARRRRAIEDKHDEAVVISALNAGDRLAEASNNAADVLVTGLLDEDIQVQLRSAESILDRTGYGKQTKTQNSSVSLIANLTPKAIENLQSTLKILKEDDEVQTVAAEPEI